MWADPATHVIDANVVAAWSLDRPWSAAAATFRSPENWLIAPDLIVHEVGNVLWLNVKAGAIDQAQAEESYGAVTTFVELVSGVNLRHEALNLAIRLGHPIYDCFYLALAKQADLPLLTADRELADHAKEVGLSAILLT